MNKNIKINYSKNLQEKIKIQKIKMIKLMMMKKMKIKKLMKNNNLKIKVF